MGGHRPPRPTGFTLLELLVVLAIIAVLLGLLAPAVQKARTLADQVRCRNNLRQLGLAFHQYHDTHGVLPAAYEYRSVPGYAAVPAKWFRWSAFTHILPFLEQQPLYDQLDITIPLYQDASQHLVWPRNQYGVGQRVAVLRCPSDPRDTVFPQFGAGNYVLCVGSGSNGGQRRQADGVFAVGRRVRLTDVTDGLSNTAFVSESLLGPGPDTTNPAQVVPRLYYAKLTQGPLTPAACTAAAVWQGDRCDMWSDGPAVVYDHFYPPNVGTWDCNADGDYGWRAARSLHTGGVQVLFGDGHVRLVANSINLDTWRALATRSGDDLPGDF